MKSETILYTIACAFILAGCSQKSNRNESDSTDSSGYAVEVLEFNAAGENPVFSGTGEDTWDQKIRERGYILKEDSMYHMWYTGYREQPSAEMHLGYATSPDGLKWTRYEGNPIFDSGWVEDMMVLKHEGKYYMFAEGKDDIAHMLTSTDRIHWKEHGPLDIRSTNGMPISKGPYGTPTVWLEGGVWYLFYERGDLGIWLATSHDRQIWTNKQDDPVLKMGPETYDQYGVAFNQVVKHKGKYYAYYHATEYKDWREWTSCVAMSDDLIHWSKYAGNPIQRENKSSPILVHDGEQYRLYTMHENVAVHFPVGGDK